MKNRADSNDELQVGRMRMWSAPQKLDHLKD